ncbi:unnamed protein product [Dicrocoelium dendriticum]|nr:unnamed protein product [Dicrocoelium dendriticum]
MELPVESVSGADVKMSQEFNGQLKISEPVSGHQNINILSSTKKQRKKKKAKPEGNASLSSDQVQQSAVQDLKLSPAAHLIAHDRSKDGQNMKSHRSKTTNCSLTQTDPPSVPICELYEGQDFPVGEIMDYPIEVDG